MTENWGICRFSGTSGLVRRHAHVGISINVLFISKWGGTWNLTKPSQPVLLSFCVPAQTTEPKCASLGEKEKSELGHLNDMAPIQPQGHAASSPDFVLPSFAPDGLVHNCKTTAAPSSQVLLSRFDSSAASNRCHYQMRSIRSAN